jgi:hypothetical protein
MKGFSFSPQKLAAGPDPSGCRFILKSVYFRLQFSFFFFCSRNLFAVPAGRSLSPEKDESAYGRRHDDYRGNYEDSPQISASVSQPVAVSRTVFRGGGLRGLGI